MKQFKTRLNRISTLNAHAVNAYQDGIRIHQYDSLTHASRYTGHSIYRLSRHIAKGTPIDGVYYFKASSDPHIVRETNPDDSTRQVVAFDRYTNEYVCTYRDLRQVAEACHRTRQTVFDWLIGAKPCTDPDFYFRWIDDCSDSIPK